MRIEDIEVGQKVLIARCGCRNHADTHDCACTEKHGLVGKEMTVSDTSGRDGAFPRGIVRVAESHWLLCPGELAPITTREIKPDRAFIIDYVKVFGGR